MLRNNKKLISLILGAVILGGFYQPISVKAAVAENVSTNYISTNRIGGENRIKTSINISKQYWTSSKNVIIARGDDFADALCAAPLAKLYDSPILLTERENITEEIKEEIKRLGAENIYVIGGQGAISEEAEKQLRESLTVKVERISGNSRYETSVEIAKRINVKGKVIISTGDNFADALGIAAIAAINDIPILLTSKGSLPECTQAYIKDKKIVKSYILGGEGVVSKDIEVKLPPAERLFGKDRYETNLAVLKEFNSTLNYDKVFTAVGGDFADALAGSAAAAKNKAPMLLVANELNKDVENFVNGELNRKSEIIALGGENVLPNATINKLFINAISYDREGFVYGGNSLEKLEEVKGNVSLEGNSSKINNAKIDGSLYIYGSNTEVNNIEVTGNIYLDPGENGNIKLNGVKANKIKIKSGAGSSTWFKNVKISTLDFNSKNRNSVTRLVLEGGNDIKNTNILSNAAMDLIAGDIGQINIESNFMENRQLQLKGNFKNEIRVMGEASLKMEEGSTALKVVVKTENPEKVQLKGNIKQLELAGRAYTKVLEGSKIEVVTNTENSKNVVLEVDKGAEVKEAPKSVTITGENAGSVKIVDSTTPNTNTTTSNSGGSSSGGNNNGNDEKEDHRDGDKLDGKYELNVFNDNVTVKFVNLDTNIKRVSLVIYKYGTNTISYMGEGQVVNGQCTLKTNLGTGEYQGELMGIDGSNKILTKKFSTK